MPFQCDTELSLSLRQHLTAALVSSRNLQKLHWFALARFGSTAIRLLSRTSICPDLTRLQEVFPGVVSAGQTEILSETKR